MITTLLGQMELLCDDLNHVQGPAHGCLLLHGVPTHVGVVHVVAVARAGSDDRRRSRILSIVAVIVIAVGVVLWSRQCLFHRFHVWLQQLTGPVVHGLKQSVMDIAIHPLVLLDLDTMLCVSGHSLLTYPVELGLDGMDGCHVGVIVAGAGACAGARADANVVIVNVGWRVAGEKIHRDCVGFFAFLALCFVVCFCCVLVFSVSVLETPLFFRCCCCCLMRVAWCVMRAVR